MAERLLFDSFLVAVIFGDGGRGDEIPAVQHYVVVACFGFHLEDLLILHGDGIRQLQVPALQKRKLPVCILQRSRHDRVRRVPGFFHLNEILPELPADLRALDHAELLCHVDGKQMIDRRAAAGAFAQK